MRIGVDIDNVISKFEEGLLKAYLKHDVNLRNTGVIDDTKWVRDGRFDWTKEEENEFYKSNIEQIAINLDVIEGAQEYIEKLMQEGNEIYIISGRDNNEYKDPYEMTKDWLKKHNINYTKLILTNAYDSHAKTIECKNNNIEIMIDDSIKICEDLNKNGIRALMMERRLCKQKACNIENVRSWPEIYSKITGKKMNVILDTDTYNECDDQFALAYLLKSQDIFNIEAITIAPFKKNHIKTTDSGIEMSYNEARKICELCGEEYINKIYKGSTDYMNNGYNIRNEAVEKIINTCLKNEKTYIMCIAALTNLALAIKLEPKIIEKIEVIWIGGNALLDNDNNNTNFKDVEAVRTIFESKCNLTVLPCSIAQNLKTSIYELDSRLKNKNKLCDLLYQRFIEFSKSHYENFNRKTLWDIGIVAYLISKSWFKTIDVSCPIIKDDMSYEITTARHTIKFITYINDDAIYEDLFNKLV